MAIQIKDYVAAIYDKGGIGTEDILDGAITAKKLANDLKSSAITNLPESGNDVDDVAAKVNSILVALRKAGIIASA
ncbi:MAG TPA: hypothetical protein PLS98_09480 [Dictyoglomaceae bacterium]|nr:hypothetical protein [Dictyoglomaceae bacterium]